jgi:hypothetical protein
MPPGEQTKLLAVVLGTGEHSYRLPLTVPLREMGLSSSEQSVAELIDDADVGPM